MHYTNLAALTADPKTALKGPVALILVEDTTEVGSTVKHHADLGFANLVLFCPHNFTLPTDMPANVHRVDFDITADDALPTIVNGVIAAAPTQWLFYCYNAEYLLFPFCEHRAVTEVLTFMSEERRDSVMTYTVDLYARDLEQSPDAVDVADAYFDGTGYYALARKDDQGENLDRQLDIFGGLRWRFEEHIPKKRQRLNRSSLFRALPNLKMLPDGSLSAPEHNTVSCPWHHNLTAATASFRTAKALRNNPGSRHAIANFYALNSVPFTWSSQQLLEIGLIEPGQWF